MVERGIINILGLYIWNVLYKIDKNFMVWMVFLRFILFVNIILFFLKKKKKVELKIYKLVNVVVCLRIKGRIDYLFRLCMYELINII